MDYDIGLDALEDLNVWVPRFLKFRNIVRLNVNWEHMSREIRRAFSPSEEVKRSAQFPVFEPNVNEGELKCKANALYEMIPSIEGAKVAKTWSGLIDLTPDMIPVLGELDAPRGFVMAAGLCGHGFALGPIIGRLISELILDGKPSLSLNPFRPSRFAEGKIPMPSKLL